MIKFTDWKREENTVYALNEKGVNHFMAGVQGAGLPQSEKEEIAEMMRGAYEVTVELATLRKQVAALRAALKAAPDCDTIDNRDDGIYAERCQSWYIDTCKPALEATK